MIRIVFLLLLSFSLNAFSQASVDSLLNILESARDTARIAVLKDLCWAGRYSNPPEALIYGLEALSLLKEVEMPAEEAEINNFIGIIQRNVGDHVSALEYFFNAQRLAEEQGHKRELAYSYNNIGDIYNRESNSRLALEYESKALDIFESIGDSVGISYCCHQISLSHANLRDYSRAIEYDLRSMHIRESMGNLAGVAYSLISLGENYLKMGNLSASRESLGKSMEIFKGLEDKYGLCFSMFSTGNYYKSIGNYNEAIRYFERSIELGVETDSRILIRNSAEALSELYAGQENYKDAYQMHKLFKNTYDSVYHEENLVKITQMVMQHEYEQKELMHTAEIARQKQLRNYLILSFGLVLVLVLVVLNRYNIKRKANIDLRLKNEEIESQKRTLENLFVSLRIKNDELQQQTDEILAQKDHLVELNSELEKQKNELNKTLNDLTQAETQLVHSEKMASLGQLTAGVAHELNNPINFINASINPLQRNTEDLLALLDKYDSVIEEEKLSGSFTEVTELKETLEVSFLFRETRNLLKGISEGASRSEQIVKNLRTFSRMDENEFKAVDIHDGIDSTLILLRNQMENKVNVNKDYGKIPHVECLPGKLNQVYMNILTNSILAIQGEGEIFIKTWKEGDVAKISIRDTGIGMAPEVRDRIFEPFFTTRKVGHGTGLGLSISYSIIREHNGIIEVISESGKGSEFLLTLPFSKEEI